MEDVAQGKSLPWKRALMLAAPALLAFVLVIVAGTGSGPGVGPDGVVYIDVARHLAAGEGPVAFDAHAETKLVTTWPPLFPALIAVGISLGLDAATAALLLNALAFGVLAVLVGLLAWRVSGKQAAAVVASWLMALAPLSLRVAGSVLSEPVFLVLEVAVLLLLLAYVRSALRRHLAWAALLAGLACMQRYAGYALAAAALLWLLQLPGRPWRSRLQAGGLFLATAAALPLAWRVIAWLAQSSIDTRTASPGLPTLLHVKSAAHSVSTWLLPETAPVALRAIAAGLIVLALLAGVLYVAQRRRDASMAPGVLLSLTGLCYCLLIAATMLLLDPLLLPDPRLMLPLLPPALVSFAWAVTALPGRARLAGIGLSALIGAGSAVRDYGVIEQLRAGSGYAVPEYADSPTLRAALDLPAGPVYATNPQPLILYGEVPARALPLDGAMEYLLPAGTSPWPDLAGARKSAREALAEGGYVVWFKRDGQYELLKRELALETLAVYDDGELLVSRLRK